jgi:hypothetical protein
MPLSSTAIWPTKANRRHIGSLAPGLSHWPRSCHRRELCRIFPGGPTQLRYPGAVRERRAPIPAVNAVIEASFQILPVNR